MTQDQPSTVFDWFLNQFTHEDRAKFVAQIGPHLTSVFRPGHHVLDLCCGVGAIAFPLEEYGAQVVGVDLAPTLIDLARQEAAKRESRVNFIRANVLTRSLENEAYDLVICLGTVELDFPHRNFGPGQLPVQPG